MPKYSNVLRLALDQQRAADLAPLGIAAAIAARLAELEAMAAPLPQHHHTVRSAPCRN